MKNSHTSTFTAYVTVAFLLISTFVTMVVTESHIIVAPCREGYVMVGNYCVEEY
uniref:U17-MYRTX-Mri1a n=1 Tax=Manica rubida TaxID=219785 RepID=A0A6G9KJW7_MANRB|nr:U17-MYRTX-Mri1a precursor [Manica rubida]QIQ51457.1 U17-MYRTX-Mri1c precursor variant [Manica rubida]